MRTKSFSNEAPNPRTRVRGSRENVFSEAGRKWSGVMAGVCAALLATGGIGSAAAQPSQATADMRDPNGDDVGQVELRQLEQGVLFLMELDGLPQGEHAIHVHETGVCEEPDFTSSGGHYAPLGNAHGFDHERGHHAGDLPNIHASANGRVRTQIFSPHLTFESTPGQSGAGQDEGRRSSVAQAAMEPFPLFDEDGSAIVVHRDPDDYESQPSGAGGPRIACGEIEPPG